MKTAEETLQEQIHNNRSSVLMEDKYVIEKTALKAMKIYAEQEAKRFSEWIDKNGYSITNTNYMTWEKSLRRSEVAITTDKLYEEFKNAG